MNGVIGIIMCLVVVAWMSATPAYAISISFDDASTLGVDSICNDGDGCDLNPAAGAITFIGAVGTFSTNITTGVTYPVLGTQAYPWIELSSIDVSSGIAGTLTISISETDYSGPSSSFTTAVGGNTQGTVSFASFLDNSNTLFGMANSIGTLGPFSSGAFSGTTTAGAAVTNPFSLTMMATITHGSGGLTTNLSSGLTDPPTTVPEPSSLLLLGSGLLGLAFWGRKRFRSIKN